jgi:DNA-binding LytR/AlgR family response regulator
MSQSEASASTEGDAGEEFIAVQPWVDPDHNETDGSDRNRDQVVLLARSQVTFVRIEGHHLHLHTITGEIYLLRGTLKGLEQRWTEHGFVRIHTSFLVSLPHTRELRQESMGPVVFLGSGAGGAVLPVSRRKRQEIKQQLEQLGRPVDDARTCTSARLEGFGLST